MTKIKLSDFTTEAASMGAGKKIRSILESIITIEDKIVVDFDQMARFASPFFNNSFSALAIKYGFEIVEKIELLNISEIGKIAFESSLENAKLLCENPQFKEEIEDIISNAPKKVEN